jgi:hypothetical protein
MKLTDELIQEFNVLPACGSSPFQLINAIPNYAFTYSEWNGRFSQYDYFTDEDLRDKKLVCFIFYIGKEKHIHTISEEFISNVGYLKKLFDSFKDLL